MILQNSKSLTTIFRFRCWECGDPCDGSFCSETCENFYLMGQDIEREKELARHESLRA